ncbi:NUDIX hydrolase [Candidatus Saccharibacteria bacterium]|nr:NUDIX hydrolase [Candidatus Saccharibacteria bacterium]
MIELLDLVDSNGKIIKTDVERGESMNLGGLHVQVAIVIIMNSAGNILVHRRSRNKKVNPGYIDHACGAIQSGESPETAGLREAEEEIGVTPKFLKLIKQGINEYNTYSYIFVGYSDETPKIVTPEEVDWVGILSPAELKEQNSSDKEKFVDGFFEDLELALSTKKD